MSFSQQPTEAPFTQSHVIRGYCENCQQAFRLSQLIFNGICRSAWHNDVTMHNVDIRMRHKDYITNARAVHRQNREAEYRIIEHKYTLYSKHHDDFVVSSEVTVMMPPREHNTLCRGVTMEVDMPIRRDAAESIRRQAEQTLINIAQIAQTVTPNGVTVIDQRMGMQIIDTKVKTIIGGSRLQRIPEQAGWVRKASHYHGTEAILNIDTAAELNNRSRREEAADKEPETPDPIILEMMEIDCEEDTQPPRLTSPIKEAEARPIADPALKQSHPQASSSACSKARPRGATVHIDTSTPPELQKGDDHILLHRTLQQRRINAEGGQGGPSRWADRPRIAQLREEARQAEQTRQPDEERLQLIKKFTEERIRKAELQKRASGK